MTPKLTKEHQAKVFDFKEEHSKVFSLQDKIRTCPQVEVYLQFHSDEAQYFVCLYAIKEKQTQLLEKKSMA